MDDSTVTTDNLDAKMSQFAFAKHGNVIHRQSQNIANNPRKRRRSSSDLLPTPPSQSVDYRKDNSDDIDSEQYESKPHQFRPPRRVTQFNNDRRKKRRLNGNVDGIQPRKIQSPFIPKQAGSFALPTTNTIPQLSPFVFNRNSKKSQRQNQNQIQSRVRKRTPSLLQDTMASMASFCSDISPENQKSMNTERVLSHCDEMNQNYADDTSSQYSITEYSENRNRPNPKR